MNNDPLKNREVLVLHQSLDLLKRERGVNYNSHPHVFITIQRQRLQSEVTVREKRLQPQIAHVLAQRDG